MCFWRSFILFLILFCFTSSHAIAQAKKHAPTKKVAQLIPIDFSDPNYQEFRPHAKNRTTKDGWRIEYLVKNDKTRYRDIYIKWSKGKFVGIFRGEHVLLMRSYFVPTFKAETPDRIYFEHGCATECAALLVLSKDSTLTQQRFISIVEYDLNLEQVVYTPDRSFSLDTLELSVVDLKRKVEKSVTFKNICNLTPEDSCIDSVAFGKNEVTLYATLTSRDRRTEGIKEVKTVVFYK